MATVNTTYRPGLVTVTAPGMYRLSELLDAAALRFAEELECPVDWPTLVGVEEAREGRYTATYALPALEGASS